MRGLKGPEVTREERKHLISHETAGIILFQRNILSLKQVYELCRELKELYPKNSAPPLIAVDLEGGRVNRFSHLKESFSWPSAEKLSQLKPNQIFSLAEIMGQQLNALGIDINFAPVVDIPLIKSPLLKERTFSSEAEKVISCAKAFTEGLTKGGVLPCLKHFPGHGGVSEDSHKILPRDKRTPKDRTSLKPFKILKHNPLIMTAHIEFQNEAGPATFSSFWLKTVLRKEIQFQGVIVSDDIDMEALAPLSSAKRFTKALSAGCDLILCCQKPETSVKISRFFLEQPEELCSLKPRFKISAGRVNHLRQQRKNRSRLTWPKASQILFSTADRKKLESLTS